MIGVLAEAGAVVASCEGCPVVRTQMLVKPGFLQEGDEERELVALRAAHAVDEVVGAFGSAQFPLFAADLEHSPVCGEYGCAAVNLHGGGQAGVLGVDVAAVLAGVGAGKHHGVALLVAREVDFVLARHAAELRQVKVDYRQSGLDESRFALAGFDFHDGLDGRDFDAETPCRIHIVLLRENVGHEVGSKLVGKGYGGSVRRRDRRLRLLRLLHGAFRPGGARGEREHGPGQRGGSQLIGDEGFRVVREGERIER